MGFLLVGSLVVATAVLASPVPARLTTETSTNNIQSSWSRTSGPDFVDQTWWAVRNRCAADNVAERLLCAALSVAAQAVSTGFEAKVSDDTGLPLPAGWAITTAKNSPFITSVYVETPLDLAAVLGFYRVALAKRGWAENDGAVVAPDRALIAFTTTDGPALLRLSRHDDKTIAEVSLRKPAVAKAGLLPKPGQAKLMLGNKTDEDAIITINERTITLAAEAGGKLANSDTAAGELPDSQKLDLPPGKYKVTLQVASGGAQNREFEVAANETWGLLVGACDAPLLRCPHLVFASAAKQSRVFPP
ncbi:hypothetical protein [Bradyrhizobium sp. McL0616]|uniref:hypothetical protein n=1 Tax=Bradyrhizobium sp. McL0616 TaxID=3415674 RepID=UPI003CF4571E